MKCNRCGKEVDGDKVFCDECQKHLKNFSSRREVRELESLIEEHNNLNEFEKTIEINDLDKLVEEELLEKSIKTELEESNKLDDTIEKKAIKEEIKSEKIDSDKDLNISKKNNKLIFIIIGVVLFVIILIIIICMLFIKPKKDKKPTIEIDYKSVINTYGDKVTVVTKEYSEKNDDIPTWNYVLENIDYKRYKVECNTHDIYKDGSIYLANCKVDNKKTRYTYGIQKKEENIGIKIEIYEKTKDELIFYSTDKSNNKVGTITCKTDSCEFEQAFDKFALIKENNESYLYDYINDTLVFGPFIYRNELDLLYKNEILYGIVYNDENKRNIYNVNTGKILKNIAGEKLENNMNCNMDIMYKYNYVIFNENNENNFINLKTGNISYSISGNILNLIENKDEKIVYITAYTHDPNKFKVYNSNGKTLFDGKEYSDFRIYKDFILSAKTNFSVYDSSFNLKTTSKTYDEILYINENYIVVTLDNKLLILDTSDNVLATFDNVWDNTNSFNSILSKEKTVDGKTGIYLVFENNITNKYTAYYYIPSTKESGFIEDYR